MQLLFVILLFAGFAAHAKDVNYQGIAKQGTKIVYIEKHHVKYADDGSLESAETDYTLASGQALAKLTSNFQGHLTAPVHRVENFVTGNIQGLRYVGDKIILYNQDKGKKEETKEIDPKSSDRILVGCQGLNYYLLDNLKAMTGKKQLPVRFLIPGQLDYYDFILKFENADANGILHFKVVIENWFLRMFAPALYVDYNEKEKRIVRYEGLSNITDSNGKLQNVVIDYKYDPESN